MERREGGDGERGGWRGDEMREAMLSGRMTCG